MLYLIEWQAVKASDGANQWDTWMTGCRLQAATKNRPLRRRKPDIRHTRPRCSARCIWLRERSRPRLSTRLSRGWGGGVRKSTAFSNSAVSCRKFSPSQPEIRLLTKIQYEDSQIEHCSILPQKQFSGEGTTTSIINKGLSPLQLIPLKHLNPLVKQVKLCKQKCSVRYVF
jgi:hypothetical protein